MRRFLPNLALLIFTVLLFAGGCEIALRILFARSLDFSMEMWKYAVAMKQPVADPLLSFIHVPNRSAVLMGVPVTISSAGLRDREFPVERPAGVFRIVALGDSTTFGWGVRVEDTAAKIIERQLNASGQGRFEVINAGVGNYNTVQEVEHYITYDRAFHPDMVILEYFINDAEPVPKERALGPLGHSYLAAFTVARFDGLLRLTGSRPQWRDYYANLYRPRSPDFEAAKHALAVLAAYCRRDRVRLLVTILPELHQINHDYPFGEQHKMVQDALAPFRVPSIDLIEGLRGHGDESTLWVTPADTHPNRKANELVAAQVTPWILNSLR